MKLKIRQSADREAVKEYIDSLPEGKTFEVVITHKPSKRTIDQNKLYWLWLSCIAKDGELGYSAEELHIVFVQKFLGAKHRIVYGEQVLNPPSTRRLTTAEFTEYLNCIETFSSTELGIVLPRPEDKSFEQFYEQYNR
jgi:hypothetical protein